MSKKENTILLKFLSISLWSNFRSRVEKIIKKLSRGNRSEIEEKRKKLETIILEGEDLRGEIKKQIKHSPVLRHKYADNYSIGVENWYSKAEFILEELFDTRMVASKFKNSLSLQLGSFESPELRLIDTRNDQEKLEDLDNQMKKGTYKLDKILEKFLKENPITDPIWLKRVKDGSLILIFLQVVIWIIYKLTGADLRGWIKLP